MKYFLEFVIVVSLSLLLFFVSGCNFSSGYSIFVENKLDEHVRDVSISYKEKSFDMGVVGKGVDSGFMDAHTLFGDNIPDVILLSFTTDSGEKFAEHEIKISKTSRSRRSIRIVIETGLVATGKYE